MKKFFARLGFGLFNLFTMCFFGWGIFFVIKEFINLNHYKGFIAVYLFFALLFILTLIFICVYGIGGILYKYRKEQTESKEE